MNVFLVFEGLQQPAQTIADRRLLRHGAILEQLTIARFIVAHDHMQLIHLAAGALNQINMAGVQWVKFTKHNTHFFLTARKFQAKKTVQRFQLLRTWAFDFIVQQLAKIALSHTAGIGHLLQRTAFLLNCRLQVIELPHSTSCLVC